MSSDRVCPLCSSNGVASVLKLYQINETEAAYMCTNKQCPYPVGVCNPDHVVVHRTVPEFQPADSTRATTQQ